MYVLCISVLVHPVIIIFKFPHHLYFICVISHVNFRVIQPLGRRVISEVCLTCKFPFDLQTCKLTNLDLQISLCLIYKFPFYNHVCVTKGGVATMATLNQSLQQWLK